ncbi:hypothetical protein LZ30DRAFT_380656 [Colletotrichum cereale]|nr:hypothetical protein LZ30DRAFT_380656 [Colletotrichum cereale]
MTLRGSMSMCTDYITKELVYETAYKACHSSRSSSVVPIYHNVVLSRLAAYTSTGVYFTISIRTSPRSNTSQVLRQIPPMIDPQDIFKYFVTRVDRQNYKKTSSTKNKDVILNACYGSCYGHVHLLRSMMFYGVTPPKCRFFDTLVFLKCIMGMR